MAELLPYNTEKQFNQGNLRFKAEPKGAIIYLKILHNEEWKTIHKFQIDDPEVEVVYTDFYVKSSDKFLWTSSDNGADAELFWE